MKKINALVVDDSKEFTEEVQNYFAENTEINILNVIQNGKEVIPYVKSHVSEIDVILMDLILPGKDGLAILSELKDLKINKHVIVLSSYGKE